MDEYHFKIKTLESGQRQRYGDSYYHYEIEDLLNLNELVVKNFCTGFAHTAISPEERKKKIDGGDFGANFASYFTEFKRIDEKKYSYKVTTPSTC